MIFYFSGTGNSEYVAQRIGAVLHDETINLFDRLREDDCSGLFSTSPFVIICPTYAWRIPRILHNWIKNTPLSGNENIYFVMTCGSSMGNASAYLERLCAAKKASGRITDS